MSAFLYIHYNVPVYYYDWSTARISAIYKKGDKSNPSNYRPVSLTCITCKSMEHVVCSQITTIYCIQTNVASERRRTLLISNMNWLIRLIKRRKQMYINGIAEGVTSQMRMFADDCIVYRQIQTPADHFTLASNLN